MKQANFFLNYNNTLLQFPVIQNNVSYERSGNNTTYKPIDGKPVSLARSPDLGAIEFSSFLPRQDDGISLSANYLNPMQYIAFIEKIRDDRQPVLLVASGVEEIPSVNVLINKFNYDVTNRYINYSLSLQEYNPPTFKYAKIPIASPPPSTTNSNSSNNKSSSSNNGNITVGMKVIANGRLHIDSWGNKPGKTEKNAVRYVTKIVDKSRKCPYHLTMDSVGNKRNQWRGWVTKESVRPYQ